MLKENKITNVVLENTQLKETIRDLIEENDQLKSQIVKLREENEVLQERCSKKSIYGNLHDNGQVTQRDVSRYFENADISVFDFDKSGYDTNHALDIKKLLALKDDYPDLFAEKLLKSHKIIEKRTICS